MVPFSAAVNSLRLGSVSYTAIVAVLTGVSSWTLVLFYDRVPKPAGRAAAIGLALIAWMLGLFMIDGSTRQGLQFIMVQTSFVGALLLASTARRIVGDRLDVVVARCLRITASILIASEIGLSHVGGGPRVAAIASLLCMSWFLAEYRLGNSSSLLWSLASLVGIAVSLSRTALFAGFVLIATTMILTPGARRIRNAIFCVLLVVVGIWAVTSWAPLRDRFFQGDLSLSVGGVKVNTEGRTEVWSVLWAGVQNDPIIGHGPGTASALSVSLDAAFDNPHNDYLRILYDFGAIGLALSVWFSIRAARLLRYCRKRHGGQIPTVAALGAGLAVLIMMTTDNPLDYPVVMIPLGALIGLGLGTRRADFGRFGRSLSNERSTNDDDDPPAAIHQHEQDVRIPSRKRSIKQARLPSMRRWRAGT